MLSFTRVRLAAALAAFAVLFGGLAASASAAPALWLVETPQAKVYLFGTVHVLRPQTLWHTPALDAALAQSQELWLEVANPDDSNAAGPMMMQLGVDREHPLSTKLPKSDLPRLDDAAKSIGIPEAAFEPMRPWLASMMLSVLPLTKAGYDPKSGVELQLKTAFTTANKPVRGFETLEQQVHYFADLPEDQQIKMLEGTLDEAASAATTLDGLVTAWTAGDLARFASIEKSAMFANSPPLYDTLVVRRNADFAKQIAARLQQPGVAFVAVGAAHLAGTDSVQAGLEKLGYRARRVQ